MKTKQLFSLAGNGPAAICRYFNGAVLIGVSLYFFLIPGFTVAYELSDANIRSAGMPRSAWGLHRALSPRYEHGEVIYCLPNQPLQSGQDIVISFLNDHESMLCRFAKQDRATQRLHCELFNPPGKQVVNTKEIIEIFTVVGRG